MRSRSRRLREFAVVGVVMALVLGVVVAAVQADGERVVRSQTNDGGAWLVNRDAGVVGHVNRSVAEITGAVRAAAPDDDIDSEQSDELVVVVNATSGVLTMIDPTTFQIVKTVVVPVATRAHVSNDLVTLWTDEPQRVWRYDSATLGQLDELPDDDAVIAGDEPSLTTVTRFDTVVTLGLGSGQLQRLGRGDGDPETVELGDVGTEAVALSASGDDAIVLTRAGTLSIVPAGADEPDAPVALGNASALGQPSLPDDPILAVDADGRLLGLDRSGQVATTITELNGVDPLPPLAHRGCVFAVTARPAELTRRCGGADERIALPGVTGRSLRLRLINNWVWVNDLESGTMWVLNDVEAVDRIDDWGAVLGTDEGEGEESDEAGDGQVEQRENPDADDAELIRADEIDEDDVNEPPVARDDTASTRVDLPVVIDALRNDEDPDGDVILISDLTEVPDGAVIGATGDRRRIQVSPPAGFVGAMTFSYTITDGRGGADTARVTLDVIDPRESENRPPIAVTDVVEARAGAPVELNVLDNDSDPDGDAIVLDDVSIPAGSVTFDGSGQVTYVPDAGSDARTIDLEYTVRDTLGASSEGRVRVSVRLADSNNEPDARNDSAVAVVDRPATFNVLLNDTDPDGDAISVAGIPTLLEGDPESIEATLGLDGEMLVIATAPGDYVYRYAIIDGSERDEALIRIRVDEPQENRPPTAVRDDVTIDRGASGTVFVLQNDIDPDGDVVTIDGWVDVDHLEIDVVDGIGLVVSVDPDAPDQVEFRYAVTDGINDSVFGIVVIAVTSGSGRDQPPVVVPDVIEIRPGSATSARVLLNDRDPEGGPLRVNRVSAVDGATIVIGPAGQEVFVTLDPTATAGFRFTYDTIDQAGQVSGTFVDVRIVPDDDANRPPTARSDTARTRSATEVTIPVLANDSDPDGDVIRLESIAAQPAAGTASITDTGEIRYLPDREFRGTDRLRYVIVDEFGDRAIGEVLIGVIPDNDENRPPTALDDRFVVVAGSDPARLAVVANDYDLDGDDIRIIRTSGGPAIEVPDDRRAIVFRPPAAIEAESVEVTITYEIDDGRGGTDDATVTVVVQQFADPLPPVALDDTAGPIREGETAVVDVLANDLDPDGRLLDLAVVSLDGAGTPGTEPGTLQFVAGSVTTSHPYSITDADGLSAEATVTIVVAENVAPTVTNLETTTPFATALAVDLSELATDADGDTLFFVCCDAVRNGGVDLVSNAPGQGVVRFTPNDEFSGVAGFSFTVDDQRGHQVSGSVTVAVEPKENEPPTAEPLTLQIEAGTSASVALDPLTADPDDFLGDVPTFGISDTSHAGISLAGSTVTIDVPIDAAGEQRAFRYTVTDRAGETATAVVTAEVTEATARPPIAVDDAGETTQGVAVTVDVLGNDVDPLGQGLRVVSAGSTEPVGTIESSETSGSITFTPIPTFFGSAAISYTVEDARRTANGRATGVVRIEVIGFPDAPPTPTAIADDATASVTWATPAANGGAIEAIEVESDQGQLVSLPLATGHTFNGLQNGVDHRFRVRARNVAGWGDWSDWSLPVTPDTAPGRPAAPTVQFLDQALEVAWTEPANDGSAIVEYVLEIGGGTSDVVTLPASTDYVWPGLVNGTSYQFRVTARNASGASPTSAWSAPEHPLREPDAPPTPSAGRGDGFLDLSWAAPVDNGDPVIEYQVEMQSAAGNLVATTDRTYRWANLPNGTDQRFRVRARNRASWGAWSGWSAAERPCGVPDAPTNPSTARGDQQATLSWSRPGDNGCAIDGYDIRNLTTGAVTFSNDLSASPSQVIGGLTNGTSYTFEIRASNVMGEGPWSAASPAVVPAGPPFAPTGFTASPGSGVGVLDYSAGAANPNGSAVTRHDLRIDGVTEATSHGAGPVSGSRTGLAGTRQYTLQLRACNSVGCGPWSNSSTATTYGPPPSITGLTGNGGNLFMEWNWNSVPVTGPNQRITGTFYGGIIPDPVNLSSGTTTYRRSGTSSVVPNINGTLTLRVCHDFGCSTSVTETAYSNVPPTISLSQGASAQGLPGCSSSACRWVSVSLEGFAANSSYTITCTQTSNGDVFHTGTATTDFRGRYSDSTLCYFGFPGDGVRVSVGGQSQTINW